MASLIPGYEYDIFIGYFQEDKRRRRDQVGVEKTDKNKYAFSLFRVYCRNNSTAGLLIHHQRYIA